MVKTQELQININGNIELRDPNSGCGVTIDHPKQDKATLVVTYDQVTFDGFDLGIRPVVATAFFGPKLDEDFTSWTKLEDGVGIDSGTLAIWGEDDSDIDPSGTDAYDQLSAYKNDQDDVVIAIMRSGAGDGYYNVYVKKDNNDNVIAFAVDMRD